MASFASTKAAWTKKISENHGQLCNHGSCLDPKERAKVGVNNGQYIRLNQERKKKKKKVSEDNCQLCFRLAPWVEHASRSDQNRRKKSVKTIASVRHHRCENKIIPKKFGIFQFICSLAQAACVRHACLRATCVACPLLLPSFSLSFFLSLSVLCFLPTSGNLPCAKICFPQIFWHN